MMKKLLLILIIVVVSLLSTSIIYGQENNSIEIKVEIINPSDGYKYSLKRLKEKTILFLLSVSKNKKADYFQEILEKRLSEVYVVAKNKDIANIEKSSLRYAATAGELTEFIIKHKLDDRKTSLREILKKHISILEQAKLNYGSQTAEWRFLHDDINYLNSYISDLNKDNSE